MCICYSLQQNILTILDNIFMMFQINIRQILKKSRHTKKLKNMYYEKKINMLVCLFFFIPVPILIPSKFTVIRPF
jgi:hypothetical protein